MKDLQRYYTFYLKSTINHCILHCMYNFVNNNTRTFFFKLPSKTVTFLIEQTWSSNHRQDDMIFHVSTIRIFFITRVVKSKILNSKTLISVPHSIWIPKIRILSHRNAQDIKDKQSCCSDGTRIIASLVLI